MLCFNIWKNVEDHAVPLSSRIISSHANSPHTIPSRAINSDFITHGVITRDIETTFEFIAHDIFTYDIIT